jgi:CheY-like chemotaxis protein
VNEINRILIAEDQLAVALLLEYQLEGLGDIHVAAGEERARDEFAWLLAGTGGGRMAIVDLGLPARGAIDPDGGFRIIAALEASGADVPVVVLTIRNDHDGLQRCKTYQSVWYYFTKPWDSAELGKAAQACLSGTAPNQAPVVRGSGERSQ